jgi:hypothetical protein
MTDINGRTAQTTMSQLETSLKRPRTDHLDLLQYCGHEVPAGRASTALLRAAGDVQGMALQGRDNGPYERTKRIV